MRYQITGCTVRKFIGTIINYTRGDRVVTIDDADFAVIRSTDNCIQSYNCVFWVREI